MHSVIKFVLKLQHTRCYKTTYNVVPKQLVTEGFSREFSYVLFTASSTLAILYAHNSRCDMTVSLLLSAGLACYLRASQIYSSLPVRLQSSGPLSFSFVLEGAGIAGSADHIWQQAGGLMSEASRVTTILDAAAIHC